MVRSLRLLVPFLVVAASPICQMFVVDVNNGPGTNFTSLAVAAATVPDGATLLVRPGNYNDAGPVITGKSLTILGAGASTTFARPIVVRNLQPQQQVTLHGLWAYLDFGNCAGAITLDRVEANWWSAAACTRLVMTECTFTTRDQIVGCVAVAEDCTFIGHNAVCNPAWPCSLEPEPGLDLAQCDFVLRRCTVRGGRWNVPAPLLIAQPGMLLTGSTVTLLDSLVSAGEGMAFFLAVSGGVVTADPSTVFSPPQGAPLVVVGPMPRVASTGLVPGGTTTADVAGVPGHLAILLVGLPGAPLTVPGFPGAFWLDPAAYQFYAIGNVPLTAVLSVPNVPAFRGLQLAWQAVTFDAAGAVQVSNPSFDLVR